MANILVHKIGSGEPAKNKLATGEFGVDVGKKILWVGTDTGDAVELSGGDINWDQIIDVPGAIDIIVNPDNPGYISLDALAEKVENNSSAIGVLQAELIRIEGKVDANKSLITQNTADIEANATLLGTQGSAISANSAQIALNKSLSEQNKGGVESNLARIVALEAGLEGALTGLTLGGQYDASVNVVRSPTTEGFEAGLKPGESLPATAGTKGIYVVVTVEGKLSGTGIAPIGDGKADDEMAFVGDWLVSDGIHGWVLFSFHTDSTQWGMIGGDIGLQDDLQAQFTTKVGVDDTIGGGNYNL
jgi:hypothetical protein